VTKVKTSLLVISTFCMFGMFAIPAVAGADPADPVALYRQYADDQNRGDVTAQVSLLTDDIVLHVDGPPCSQVVGTANMQKTIVRGFPQQLRYGRPADRHVRRVPDRKGGSSDCKSAPTQRRGPAWAPSPSGRRGRSPRSAYPPIRPAAIRQKDVSPKRRRSLRCMSQKD
jgi:hypothetical protein